MESKIQISVACHVVYDSTKNYLNKSGMFYEDLLPHKISIPYIK
jgi:hypothetical protein